MCLKIKDCFNAILRRLTALGVFSTPTPLHHSPDSSPEYPHSTPVPPCEMLWTSP